MARLRSPNQRQPADPKPVPRFRLECSRCHRTRAAGSPAICDDCALPKALPGSAVRNGDLILERVWSGREPLPGFENRPGVGSTCQGLRVTGGE